MTIRLHRGDLPADFRPGPALAVDTETLGLNPHRDRLCVVQISRGDGGADVVQIVPGERPERLIATIADASCLKIFHFARFDLAVLFHRPRRDAGPDLLHEGRLPARPHLHGPARPQGSDQGTARRRSVQAAAILRLGRDALTPAQVEYAASDVLHLHALREKLDRLLAREDRAALAQACFDFLPTRARLDLLGWPDTDIFAHS
jgi:ribonuclease D